MPVWTNEKLAAGLHASRGMVYVAAKNLGCSPNTIKKRLEHSRALQEIVEAESGFVTDTAELKLFQAIMGGEPWAVQFHLKTKGKNRGYVERQEVTGRDGNDIGVKVTAIDYRTAIAPLAPGPMDDSESRSQD